MITKLYLVYGLVVVGLMGTAEYRGWRLTSFNEARTMPRSVRAPASVGWSIRSDHRRRALPTTMK